VYVYREILSVKFFLKSFFVLVPLALGLFMMNGCHKELFTNKGGVSFSTDTLTFDTVFTTLGSVTQGFTIRNTQSKSINISDIKLLQLSGTQFRILVPPNPAATPGIEYKNIDIPAHDSIYVFVEVTVQPNNANNPFVLLDKIQFTTNGVIQDVVLEAMGQNAHYYFSYQVMPYTTFTFPNDKPNIIVNKNGGLPIFAVDTGATCIIPPGCKIFMGPGAVMTVDGTLKTSPTPTWSDSIIFQYIRTDYGGLPGEWLGITYSRIATINLSHVIIDQSTFGLSDEYVLDLLSQAQITTSNLNSYINNPIPNVTLDKVIIRNTSSSALTAIRTNLTATNCLFFSSSGSMVLLGMGGTYSMTNCTLANSYGQYTSSQNPVLTIADAIVYLNNAPKIGPYPTTVTITNSIIAGNTTQPVYNEIGFGLSGQSSDNITFRNSFLTSPADSITAYGAINTNNIDTAVEPQYLNPALFTMPASNNYMPDSGSIVLGKITSPVSPTDLYDYPRSNPSSIGAIEYHH
jgi:hypothetical protein